MENTSNPNTEVSETVMLNRQMYYLGTVISYLEQQLEFAQDELQKIEEKYHESQTPQQNGN